MSFKCDKDEEGYSMYRVQDDTWLNMTMNLSNIDTYMVEKKNLSKLDKQRLKGTLRHLFEEVDSRSELK